MSLNSKQAELIFDQRQRRCSKPANHVSKI